MDTIKYAWRWLVSSSSDPDKYAATVKGVLLLIIPKVLAAFAVVCSLGILCVQLDNEMLNSVVSFIYTSIDYILYGVGGGITLFGLLRKIYYGKWTALPSPSSGGDAGGEI